MAYVHRRVVRFADADPAGIVFFARVFHFAHEAFEDCLAAGGLPLHGVIADADWAMPLVHAQARYRRPMRLGDALDVEVRVEGHSAGAVRIAFEVRSADGAVCAEVRHVHAAIERPVFRARSVPVAFLDAFAAAGVDVPAADAVLASERDEAPA